MANIWLDVNPTVPSPKIPASEITGILPPEDGGTGTGTQFTPGSIVFASSAGVYAQDNANLFYDDGNNRVGVGTSAPTAKLDVFGSIQSSSGLYFTTAGSRIIGAPDISGTSGATNAPSGFRGEYASSAFPSTNFPQTDTTGDLSTLVLSPGDWDLTLNAVFTKNDSVTLTEVIWGISTTPGNSLAGLTDGQNFFYFDSSVGASSLATGPMQIANYRRSISTQTIFCAKFRATYAAGQPQVPGGIFTARRVR